MIYIIGGTVDIFDTSITRLIDNAQDLNQARYSIAAMGISQVTMNGYSQWELVIFGGLARNENMTINDNNNDIQTPLESIEIATFIDVTTTTYPDTTFINDDDDDIQNKTTTMSVENVTEAMVEIGDENGDDEIDWMLLFWVMIGLGILILILIICVIVLFYFVCTEKEEQRDRERRSEALSRYKSVSRLHSQYEQNKIMMERHQQQTERLRTMSIDVENLEMINRALQETANMKDVNTTDEEMSHHD